MRRAGILLALGAGLLLAAGPAAAQRGARSAPRTCELEFPNTDTTRAVSLKLADGKYNSYFGGGVFAKCIGSDQRLVADSAEHYGLQGLLVLLGHVRYTETRLKADADRMEYYTLEERLVADGNVFARTPAGTTMRGPRAEYLRPLAGVRTTSRLTATGRPRTRLSPADAKESKDTVDLVADFVVSDNDSLVSATGAVEITRPDLVATGDSAFVDNGTGFATLMRQPKVVGRGERTFTLVGTVIDLYSRDRRISRVRAKGEGKATSDELELSSDTLDLRFDDQKLHTAYAFGPGRALARSVDRDIRADSIHVEMPGQLLRTMHAVGRALAETAPDTTRMTSDEKDWLRGDTITAQFEAVRAAGDTTTRTQLREVVAEGDARSFYQLPGRVRVDSAAADTAGAGAPPAPGRAGAPATAAPRPATRPAADSAATATAIPPGRPKPNINYVTGKGITVTFANREVQLVTVRDQVTGVYLEVTPDSTRTARPGDGPEGRAAAPTRARPPASPSGRP